MEESNCCWATSCYSSVAISRNFVVDLVVVPCCFIPVHVVGTTPSSMAVRIPRLMIEVVIPMVSIYLGFDSMDFEIDQLCISGLYAWSIYFDLIFEFPIIKGLIWWPLNRFVYNPSMLSIHIPPRNFLTRIP